MTASLTRGIAIGAGIAVALAGSVFVTRGDAARPQLSVAQQVDRLAPDATNLLARTSELAQGAAGLQDAIRVCMADAGYKYDVILVRAQIEVPLDKTSPAVGHWWDEPASDAQATLGIGLLNSPRDSSVYSENTVYGSLSEEERAEYDRLLSTCGNAAGAAASAANDRLFELPNALVDELERATARPSFVEIRGSYASCMLGHGIKVSEPGDLFDVAEQRAAEVLDSMGLFIGDLAVGSKGWDEIISIESDLARADASCRAPLSDEIESALRPVADDWSVRNADAIDQQLAELDALRP